LKAYEVMSFGVYKRIIVECCMIQAFTTTNIDEVLNTSLSLGTEVFFLLG
jgi:hypothetical protein